jgi:hypothetical protein
MAIKEYGFVPALGVPTLEVDQGACIYVTGGSLRGGRKVWALAKLLDEYYSAPSAGAVSL